MRISTLYPRQSPNDPDTDAYDTATAGAHLIPGQSLVDGAERVEDLIVPLPVLGPHRPRRVAVTHRWRTRV